MKSFTLAALALLLPLLRSSANHGYGAEPTVMVTPKPALGSISNPLKGWCPYPNSGVIHQPYSMSFHYVSWKELEPTEGGFAFEQWEKDAWEQDGARGKHVVFRVYIDYPGRASGLPDWLKKQGVTQTSYSHHQGGLSPDYNHPQMIAAMEKFIAALGRRYNNHPRVAFVQLGLLGHWGEWHCWPQDDELYASTETEKRVAEAYREAFPNKLLMARYANEATGSMPRMGFHDDYFPGDTDGEDWKFLPKIRQFGREENWRRAVIGGEMQPGKAMAWLGTQYDTTQTMIERANFTWMGPYCPAIVDLSKLSAPKANEYRSRCRDLVRRMGYNFRIEKIEHPQTISRDQPFAISMLGKNLGVAPFYYPWSCEIVLINEKDEIAASQPCGWDIRRWQPNEAIDERASLTFKDVPRGSYLVGFGIRDPWTEKPSIAFANELQQIKGWSILSSVEVR